MDNLEKIYEIQKKFTEKFFNKKHNINDLKDILHNDELSVKMNKEYILSLLKESSELLDNINWKMHINKDEETIRDNLLENGIDVLKYLIGFLIINGFTSQEILNKFIDKSNVIDDKFEQEEIISKLKNKKDKNIAFIDIDGVIADWPNCYIEFVNKKLDKKYKNLIELENDISKYDLLKIKLSYRLSGIKANINIIENAKNLLKELDKNNYFIILLTARPYKKIFRIYSDTLLWLKNNEIKYDAIIWEEQKEKYIIKNFNLNDKKFVYDDNINNCNVLAQNGFTVFFKYNENSYEDSYEQVISKLDKRVIPIKSHSEFISMIKGQK